jgi:hypothetical protein
VTHTMTVSSVTLTEAAEWYPTLFVRVFGYSDPAHVPAVVYVATRGTERVGLLAGYVHNLETFYIQYAGVLPHVSALHVWRLWEQVLAQLPAQYVYVMTMIDATHRAALRLALKSGFLIMGTRTYPDGVVMVELMQERSHGLS